MTGAAGAIGLATVQMLLRAGHEVRAFVRSGPEFLRRSSEGRVELVEGDALDPAAVAAAIEGADAVIHGVDFPPRRYPLHIDALRHVLMEVAPGLQVIYPSNLWVYGPCLEGRVGPGHPKESPARLGSIRADLEDAVLASGGTVVRLPSLYGPSVRRGYLHWIFERAIAGKAVLYPGELDRAIEFLYVGDAARALVAAIGRGPARGAEFTAPGLEVTTPRAFVGLVFKASGQPLRLRSVPLSWTRAATSLHPRYRAMRDLSYLLECPPLLDGTRIRRELGWVPEIGYAEGVRRTVRRMREMERATRSEPGPQPLPTR